MAAKAARAAALPPATLTWRLGRSTSTGAIPAKGASAASTEALQWPHDMLGTKSRGIGHLWVMLISMWPKLAALQGAGATALDLAGLQALE